MPTVELNGRTAPALACPPDVKEIIYWSDELGGFGLRCRASGARSWFVQYRTKAGQMRKHTLGSPDKDNGKGNDEGAVTFAKAYKEAGRLLAAAKLGGDPAADAKKAKGAIKLGELATHYLEHQKSRLKDRSYAELERHLKTYFDGKEGKEDEAPLREHRSLLKQAAASVTQRQTVELLQRLAQTAPVAANRMRASLSAMFAWGMKAGLASSNPVAATFKPAEEQPRERVLADAELALIWSCASGSSDYDRIVRLLMLTGARREEIAGMRWSEITMNGDGTANWILPSERSKNHLPHELALPAMAAELLPVPREDEDGIRRDLVFGEGEGPFSGWSRCKERLDGRIAKALDGKAIQPWVLHDMRRTFVTRLNDLGVEPHVIEALVNHVSGAAKAGVAGVYNRSAYAAQKRAALALWCEHVARLIDKAQAEAKAVEKKVVPLRRAS